MVEVARQLSNLVPAHDLGPGGVIALGQLVGGPPQTADGGGEPVGEDEHHRAADPYHQQHDPAVDLIVGFPVVKQAADVPDRLHIQHPVGQDHGPRAVEQVSPCGLVPAQDVAGGAGADFTQQLPVAGGGQGGVDPLPVGSGHPELVVGEIGGLLQGAGKAAAALLHIFQGHASRAAHRLVGDAQQLHFLLGHGDFPLQGGLEGEGNEQIAAQPRGQQQDAQGGDGHLPGEPHSSTSSR